jgi:hypothetical protein
LLKGETEVALDYYERALEREEPTALIAIQGLPHLRAIFPDFFCSDRYLAILRKLNLDEDSLAQLSIPPLPF